MLLVEGDHAMAEMYRLGLLLRGYGVEVARDGEEGLEHVLRGAMPDVVVVDLGLPRPDHGASRKDGLDMLSTMHSIRLGSAVPILALADDVGTFAGAVQRGASECLVNWRTKPSDLARKVSELLGETAGSVPGAPRI